MADRVAPPHLPHGKDICFCGNQAYQGPNHISCSKARHGVGCANRLRTATCPRCARKLFPFADFPSTTFDFSARPRHRWRYNIRSFWGPPCLYWKSSVLRPSRRYLLITLSKPELENLIRMNRLIRAVIDARALRHNLQTIRERARSARVMAVVKANAYGHGLAG